MSGAPISEASFHVTSSNTRWRLGAYIVFNSPPLPVNGLKRRATLVKRLPFKVAFVD